MSSRRFRDALARQVELRLRYAACFPEAEHPYDVLLDDFEPGMTTAEVRPLFDGLRRSAQPARRGRRRPGRRAQRRGLQRGLRRRAAAGRAARRAARDGLRRRARGAWTTAPHPFAQSPGYGDYRITTRYRDRRLRATRSTPALHEFGHGLYDAGLPGHLRRTNLHECASLGIHESQSRLWENVIGRGLPFCTWVLPHLKRLFPGAFDALDAARAVPRRQHASSAR